MLSLRQGTEQATRGSLSIRRQACMSSHSRPPFNPKGTDIDKQGELFKDTKDRLSKRIGLKGKQFEKIKFAIIQRSIYSKPLYLNDGKSNCSSLPFPPGTKTHHKRTKANDPIHFFADDILFDSANTQDDYLGVDHVNRHKTSAGKGDSIFIR